MSKRKKVVFKFLKLYVYDWATIYFEQVMRFLTNPHKPMILALSRPDPKKNITTLLKAFGECRPLRELANLVRLINDMHNVQSFEVKIITQCQYW